jgi:hypothetical protein
MHATAKTPFARRLARAGSLNPQVFREVSDDPSAGIQAAALVGLTALLAASPQLGAGGAEFGRAALAALVGWLAWAGVTTFIGRKLLGGGGSGFGLLRALGFAQTPGILLGLVAVPGLGSPLRFGVGVWILACGILAIRESLGLSTLRAIATAVLGWLVMVAVPLLLLTAESWTRTR